MSQFYIVDKTHETFVSFWRPNAQGRTWDLRKAGTWSQEDIDKAYFRNNPNLLFVPIEAITDDMTHLVVKNETLKEIKAG